MVDMVDDYRNEAPEAEFLVAGGDYLHPLEAWRIHNNRSRTWMYKRLDVKQPSYSKWILPPSEVGQRIPRKKAMKRIVILTCGTVTANDFYDVTNWVRRAVQWMRTQAAADLRREIESEQS